MPDLDLTKLLGSQQEKQLKETLNAVTILVASAQEVVTNVGKSVEDINVITKRLRELCEVMSEAITKTR